MPELLEPCPFCGGRDIRPNRDDLELRCYRCHYCGATGGAGLNVKTAANLWNRRANGAATFPPQTKQEVVDEIAKRLEVSQDEKLLRIVLRMLS